MPIYYQLKQIIIKNIEEGVWGEGELIPSEREFSEKHEVSRMTVRQALSELVNEGVLIRKRGIGTFVLNKKFIQNLEDFSNFTLDMKQRQLKPGGKVLEVKHISVSEKLASLLKLKEGDIVIQLVRLRSANGFPIALEISHLPYKKVFESFNQSLEDKSLYKELRDKSGINLVRAKQTLEISYVQSRKDAEVLNLELGAPVLYIERLTFDDHNVPMEFVQSLYRADKFKFSIDMSI